MPLVGCNTSSGAVGCKNYPGGGVECYAALSAAYYCVYSYTGTYVCDSDDPAGDTFTISGPVNTCVSKATLEMMIVDHPAGAWYNGSSSFPSARGCNYLWYTYAAGQTNSSTGHTVSCFDSTDGITIYCPDTPPAGPSSNPATATGAICCDPSCQRSNAVMSRLYGTITITISGLVSCPTQPGVGTVFACDFAANGAYTAPWVGAGGDPITGYSNAWINNTNNSANVICNSASGEGAYSHYIVYCNGIDGATGKPNWQMLVQWKADAGAAGIGFTANLTASASPLGNYVIDTASIAAVCDANKVIPTSITAVAS